MNNACTGGSRRTPTPSPTTRRPASSASARWAPSGSVSGTAPPSRPTTSPRPSAASDHRPGSTAPGGGASHRRPLPSPTSIGGRTYSGGRLQPAPTGCRVGDVCMVTNADTSVFDGTWTVTQIVDSDDPLPAGRPDRQQPLTRDRPDCHLRHLGGRSPGGTAPTNDPPTRSSIATTPRPSDNPSYGGSWDRLPQHLRGGDPSGEREPGHSTTSFGPAASSTARWSA